MSPTGIFAVLLLALIIDWMSVGPDSIRDRVAFCLALPAIRDGWDGSAVDRYTVGFAGAFIDQVKLTGNARIAQASTAVVLGVGVGALAVYCLGCLMPERAAAKVGPWAQLAFKGRAATGGGGGGRATAGRYRLNGRLWACAWLLGMLADLPNGAVGSLLRGGINGLEHLVAPLPNILFGAS